MLGRLFGTFGRRGMITATYFIGGLGMVIDGYLVAHASPSVWVFVGILCVTFFFASAAASSAYLTVSEIFPLETRAMAIALFYAIATGIGGAIARSTTAKSSRQPAPMPSSWPSGSRPR